MKSDILDVFDAHKGIVAVAGAGGKKSAIYRLATAHSGRIAVTATVHTPRFRQRLNVVEVVSGENELFANVEAAARRSDRIAYAHPSEKAARLRGVAPNTVTKIHHRLDFDVTLVKADGARLRWIKAHDHNRPVLPRDTTVLISILSIRAIGKPMSEDIAHHAHEVADVMGLKFGEIVTATHLARLMSSDHDVLKQAGGMKLIPVLNMVESRQDLRLARFVAEKALERTTQFERVVLTSMIRDEPVLEVLVNDSAHT